VGCSFFTQVTVRGVGERLAKKARIQEILVSCSWGLIKVKPEGCSRGCAGGGGHRVNFLQRFGGLRLPVGRCDHLWGTAGLEGLRRKEYGGLGESGCRRERKNLSTLAPQGGKRKVSNAAGKSKGHTFGAGWKGERCFAGNSEPPPLARRVIEREGRVQVQLGKTARGSLDHRMRGKKPRKIAFERVPSEKSIRSCRHSREPGMH